MSYKQDIQGLTASGDIPAFRIVKYGAGDTLATLAAAATDALMGVSTDKAIPSGYIGDIILCGEQVPVEYGATVVRGDPLTADSVGRAIKATVAGSRLIGFAKESGVVGQIGRMIINRSVL